MNAHWRSLVLLICGIAGMAGAADADPAKVEAQPWRKATAGLSYEWPRDHRSHRGFKTEWWYFTGTLRAVDGRRFGYQLTFFRQGLRPPGSPSARSRFVVDDLKFGHFTMTDVSAGRFHFSQQLMRGAFGDAGFSTDAAEPRLAWLGRWSLHLEPNGGFRIAASEEGREIELELAPRKPWVVQGINGLSVKAAASPDNASHYYSGTRLASSGRVKIEGKEFAVSGESWFDHEWASNQLAADQAGWDWFSLQFDDNTELMLYRLRKKDGAIDAASSGTFVAADGSAKHLTLADIEITETKRWKSDASGASYPNAWRVRISPVDVDVTVTTPLANQELVLNPVTYWEGMVDVAGTRGGRKIAGHGYVELTGYAGAIVGLSSPQVDARKPEASPQR